MSKYDLTDKVAIITGGGTGIGRAIALEFARAGADSTIASRNLGNLEKVAEEVKSMGKRCLAIATDVRIPEQVDTMVQQTVNEFGRVDIMVNNAGASFPCPVEDLSPNGWDAIVNINLKGTFLCSKAAGKVMIGSKADSGAGASGALWPARRDSLCCNISGFGSLKLHHRGDPSGQGWPSSHCMIRADLF